MTDKEMMTEDETAEFLTVKPQTLAAWRCRGSHDLPFVKVGRAVRYRRTNVLEWLENRTATCASTAD